MKFGAWNAPYVNKSKFLMPNYYRGGIVGCTYFFTVVTYNRQKFLCDEVVRNSLRKAIDDTRKDYPFNIDAWVLLPDHLHCIWTLPQDNGDYSKRWASIKRYVSKECHRFLFDESLLTDSGRKRKEATIWQRRFWEHMIRDQNDYNRHLDYLHFNPIKHGLVKCLKDWPYSTFHRYVKEGFYPPDWGGGNREETNGKDFGE